jgi:hypothetical protein
MKPLRGLFYFRRKLYNWRLLNKGEAPMLIGLTGAPGCGKDTLAQKMMEHDVYERYRFADPIKNMLKQLHIREDVWEDHDQKETALPWLGRSPRYLAQTLGTEWGRNTVNPEIWVLMAKGRWHVVNAGGEGRMVIPDVRFPNEAKWIVEAGGFLLRIKRPDNGHEVDNPEHASELGFPPSLCHASVVNDGTLDELRDKAWDVINAKVR